MSHMSRLTSQNCSIVVAVMLGITLFSAQSIAQSHFSDPHAGLAVHGAGDAAEISQIAQQVYKSANDELGKWLELASKNKLEMEKPDDVAKTYVQIQQIGRA